VNELKKFKYLLLSLLTFCFCFSCVDAITIRETMDSNDEYSTIEEGSIVIGVTRFTADTVVTANKAAKAGADDAMLYVLQNSSSKGYVNPEVYYYVDSVVGWFYLNSDNKATPVSDTDILNKLSNLDIYYVNNEEKVLEIDYLDNNIIEDSLPDGVEYKDNKLFVNATVRSFEFMTNEQNKVSYMIDKTTSKFIEDTMACYSVNNGIITDYDPKCGSDIVIPVEINGEKITGISNNAFKSTGLVSVVIPGSINSIGNNAFANNPLNSVIVKEKYDKNDFSSFGDNVFGEFDNVIYDNELSRIISYVDSDFVIDYYKNFDLDFFKNSVSESQYGLIDYIAYSSIDKFEKNGYSRNYDYCAGDTCYFFENPEEDDTTTDINDSLNNDTVVENGNDVIIGNLETTEEIEDRYGISIKYIDDALTYQFSIEKYNEDKGTVDKVSKIITVSFNETGNKRDNDTVLEAIDNLKYEGSNYGNLTTRMKYLEDLVDLYDIELLLLPLGKGGPDSDGGEIENVISSQIVFYLKDGVLYQSDEIGINRVDNSYYPSIEVEDYDNIDDYVNAVLELFPEKADVKNYEIVKNSDGSIYQIGNPVYETGETYYINLIDTDYLEKWQIRFTDFYDDKYDSNGNTKGECFTVSDGVISNYNGECGVNVVIPSSINGEEITGIGWSVFYNIALKSVVLPNSLKKIESTAFSVNMLTEVVIPDSVESIGSSAFQVNEISSLKLGSGLKDIGSRAFYYNKLKKIEIPSTVESIASSAFGYNEIEELVIAEGIKTIEEQAFQNNKLTSLKLPDSLEYVGGGAFTNNLLSDNEAYIYERVYDSENDVYGWDKTAITSYAGQNRDNIVIPEGTKKIGGYAFSNLGIDEIEIPYGVETIGYYAFADNNLTYIDIPDSVKEIRNGAFEDNKFEGDNCFIYSRDKNGNVDKSILVAYVNSKYWLLDELIIPNNVKKICPSAFPHMSIGIIIDKLYIPYGVEEIGDYAFSNLKIRESFSLPKSIKKLGKEVFDYYYEMNENDGFVYARNEDGTVDKSILMAYVANIRDGSLTIPNGVSEIKENVFNSVYNLREVVLPSTLTKIGDYAFASTNLNEVNIPSSVKTIGNYAFYSIYNLNKITLNEGLESIGDYAFSSDRSIDKIIIPATVKSMGKSVFGTGVNTIEILGKSSIDDFDSVDSNLASWANNIIFEKYIPKLELPELPTSVNYYKGGTLMTTCEITDIQYEFEKNIDGTVDLKLIITGNKTFDSNGDKSKESCGVGILVDGYRYGVENIFNHSLLVGDMFKTEQILNNLPAVDMTLTLQDVNY